MNWQRSLAHLVLQSSSCRRRRNEARSADDGVIVELCCDPAREIAGTRNDKTIRNGLRPGVGHNLPLLHACRQLHDEASIAANIAYTSHTFSFPTSVALVDFATQVDNKDLAAIRIVHVRFAYDMWASLQEDLWVVKGIVCSFFDGLKELHLVAEDEPGRYPSFSTYARLVRGKKEARCRTRKYSLRLLGLIRYRRRTPQEIFADSRPWPISVRRHKRSLKHSCILQGYLLRLTHRTTKPTELPELKAWGHFAGSW